MASRRIEFELTIEKLSFKFKGDQQTAERIQGTMNSMLAAVTDAQDAMTDPEENTTKLLTTIPAPDISARGASRRRGRNKNNSSAKTSTDASGGGDVSEDASGKSPRPRRAKSVSAQDLIVTLGKEGFFTQHRTAAEVQIALSKKGHNFEGRQLGTPLLRLTQKDFLSRDKNEEDVWAYIKGPVDEI